MMMVSQVSYREYSLNVAHVRTITLLCKNIFLNVGPFLRRREGDLGFSWDGVTQHLHWRFVQPV